jgi:hypothetical protein
MSKFYNETQKAQKWAPPTPESGRLDVVSVIDAIKQSEPSSVSGVAFNEPAATLVTDQVEATAAPTMDPVQEKPGKVLIKMPQRLAPLPAPVVEAYGSLRTRVMKLLSETPGWSWLVRSSGGEGCCR